MLTSSKYHYYYKGIINTLFNYFYLFILQEKEDEAPQEESFYTAPEDESVDHGKDKRFLIKNIKLKEQKTYEISVSGFAYLSDVLLLLLLLLFIFRIVTNIQQINTYLVGYNSWSFYLSIIAVTYDPNIR